MGGVNRVLLVGTIGTYGVEVRLGVLDAVCPLHVCPRVYT